MTVLSPESFTKDRSRTKVPCVRMNLIPDTWTAHEESALPELSPCPHDNIFLQCGYFFLTPLVTAMLVLLNANVNVVALYLISRVFCMVCYRPTQASCRKSVNRRIIFTDTDTAVSDHPMELRTDGES